MASLGVGTKKKLIIEVSGRCFYCGIKLVKGNTTYDHIIPKSKNGTGRKNNLCACCKGCNVIKLNHSKEYLRDVLKEILEIDSFMFYYEKIGLIKEGEEYGETIYGFQKMG